MTQDKREVQDEILSFDPLNIYGAFQHAAQEIFSAPNTIVEKQLELWQQQMDLCAAFANGFTDFKDTKDNRFRSPAWSEQPIFRFLKETYLLNSKWLNDLAANVPNLEEKEQHKVSFYTKLFTDAMSPANFPTTNPDVLQAACESNGSTMMQGVENFMRDLDKSSISTYDPKAYQVGGNLAATAGGVVLENRLMQLLEYTPQKQTFATPLIIMPAWINKYYILDLQVENSFAKWLVEQGYKVYMISWVNPGSEHHDIEFHDYLEHGPLAAIDFLQKQLKVKEVNFVGYCLGGTLLAITLAYLKATRPTMPVKSATFLTTLIDFTEAGDLGVFIDEKQLSNLEKRMNRSGFLDGREMANTFSLIRANDMIWSFYVNNYLLGKDPMVFDILYWNADSTRLPAKMHSFYLRQMYQYNNLAKGELYIKGVHIDLRNIDIPIYILATKDDHIAPWYSTYKAVKLYGSKDITFTLSASGHVAGVVNHPAKNKYCYWHNNNLQDTASLWLEKAKEQQGSWWTNWHSWLKKQSGDLIASSTLPALDQAPGSYVKHRLDSEQ